MTYFECCILSLWLIFKELVVKSWKCPTRKNTYLKYLLLISFGFG